MGLSSRIANHKKVKLLLDDVYPTGLTFDMFSTTRFKDSANVVRQLRALQSYQKLNQVLASNIERLNYNPTNKPHVQFVLHANKTSVWRFSFTGLPCIHTLPNFAFLFLKYPYPCLGRFMLERLTRNKIPQRLCLLEVAKLSKSEVTKVESFGQALCFPKQKRRRKHKWEYRGD